MRTRAILFSAGVGVGYICKTLEGLCSEQPTQRVEPEPVKVKLGKDRYTSHELLSTMHIMRDGFTLHHVQKKFLEAAERNHEFYALERKQSVLQAEIDEIMNNRYQQDEEFYDKYLSQNRP